jgi:DNA-binding response OmpR family regulator
MIDVLLIEDDKDLTELYRTELELLGATVKVATDGKKGLELAKEDKPDLILMDVILPEKIGLSILKELKSSEETTNIPVVIMSNYDQGENPKKALELGAISFLSKQQFTPQELAKEAMAVLN